MSVLIEGISVVVRRDSIAQKLRGGWNAFTALVPNKTLCTDAELAGVAFMVESDARGFINNLEKDGLEYLRDGQNIDIVDVNQFTGVVSVCTWLEFYQGNVDGTGPQVAAARLIGGSATPVAIPRNWDFAKSLSANGRFAPDGSPDLMFLRHQNGLDVYLHLSTGKEVYSARANSEQSESADREWARVQYERCRLISAEDALDGIPPFPRLPGHLDDQVALNNWSAAWDAWIANEAVQRQRPWLRPMTPQVLAGIVQSERRLRAGLTDTEQQQELARAKNDLNALEARLRATDPQYEAKRSLLIPILQPVFKQLPPSKWVTTFEQAYSSAPLPGDILPSTIEPILSAVTDTKAIRDKIFEEFDASTSGDRRSALLATFKATMDIAESHLAKNATKQQLAEFREARADDYSRLIVKESCVDDNVSPEMLMAVTNREIAAGRLAVDDPIRQAAVKAAASPHRSHAEMVEMAEAKKMSEMSIQSLVKDLTSAKTFDIVDARAKIGKTFDAASTSDQRGRVLAIFKAVMDDIEQKLASQGNQTQMLEDLKKARAQDYNIFIVQECTVGLDSPRGGNISIELLLAVTNREIAAGRMTEGHSMRKLAVEGAAAPHFSHAELLAEHAKVKEEAEKSKVTPVPKTVGEKLMGLFRRS